VQLVGFGDNPLELLSVSSEGAVREWDPRTGALRRGIAETGKSTASASFDPVMQRVMLVATNGQAQLVELNSGRTVSLVGTVRVDLVAQAFNRQGTRV
jgi:hypothetical protein